MAVQRVPGERCSADFPAVFAFPEKYARVRDVTWHGLNVEVNVLFITEPELEESGYCYGARGQGISVGPTFKFTAPSDAGTYEIRYYSEKNGRMVAKRTIVVR